MGQQPSLRADRGCLVSGPAGLLKSSPKGEGLIIRGSKGISVQTCDRGKLHYHEKLPEAPSEGVMKKLPPDSLIISGKDDPGE